jgi:hypothetical protein
MVVTIVVGHVTPVKIAADKIFYTSFYIFIAYLPQALLKKHWK